MKKTDESMKRIAKLARIELSGQERTDIANQLEGIMEWIDMLQEVDVEGVKPFADVEYAEKSMVEMQDGVRDGNQVDAVLANAPEQAHNMFAVPKVVE